MIRAKLIDEPANITTQKHFINCCFVWKILLCCRLIYIEYVFVVTTPTVLTNVGGADQVPSWWSMEGSVFYFTSGQRFEVTPEAQEAFKRDGYILVR